MTSAHGLLGRLSFRLARDSNQRKFDGRGSITGLQFGFNCFTKTNNKIFCSFVKSNLVELETSLIVILHQIVKFSAQTYKLNTHHTLPL